MARAHGMEVAIEHMIEMAAWKPARSYDWQLVDNAQWSYVGCGEGGPVDSKGPVAA